MGDPSWGRFRPRTVLDGPTAGSAHRSPTPPHRLPVVADGHPRGAAVEPGTVVAAVVPVVFGAPAAGLVPAAEAQLVVSSVKLAIAAKQASSARLGTVPREQAVVVAWSVE